MFYVYLLKSEKDGKSYWGSTNNLKKRIEEHNSRKVHSTKQRGQMKLIYYEAYYVEKDARHREHNLKLRAQALSQLKKRLKYTLESIF